MNFTKAVVSYRSMHHPQGRFCMSGRGVIIVTGHSLLKKGKKVSHELHQLSLIFIKFKIECHEFYLFLRIRVIKNSPNSCLFV